MSKKERQLRAALERSKVALDDWINTYASDFSSIAAVHAAARRFQHSGGTLAYIANIQRQNLEALKDE